MLLLFPAYLNAAPIFYTAIFLVLWTLDWVWSIHDHLLARNSPLPCQAGLYFKAPLSMLKWLGFSFLDPASFNFLSFIFQMLIELKNWTWTFKVKEVILPFFQQNQSSQCQWEVSELKQSHKWLIILQRVKEIEERKRKRAIKIIKQKCCFSWEVSSCLIHILKWAWFSRLERNISSWVNVIHTRNFSAVSIWTFHVISCISESMKLHKTLYQKWNISLFNSINES